MEEQGDTEGFSSHLPSAVTPARLPGALPQTPPHPAATSSCFIRRTFVCLQRRLLPLFPREFGDYMLAGGWLSRLVVSVMQSFLCVWVKRAAIVTGISRPALPFRQPPWRPAPPHGFTLRCAAPFACRSWARV